MDDAWVVMRCRVGTGEHCWAWCRPRRDSPGFEEVFYTQLDGVNAWSPSGEGLPVLGDHVFTVVFPAEAVAPMGDRFPVQRIETVVITPVEHDWTPVERTVEAAFGNDAGGPV